MMPAAALQTRPPLTTENCGEVRPATTPPSNWPWAGAWRQETRGAEVKRETGEDEGVGAQAGHAARQRGEPCMGAALGAHGRGPHQQWRADDDGVRGHVHLVAVGVAELGEEEAAGGG